MSDVFSVLAGVMSAIDGRAAQLDDRFGVLASGVAGAVAALAVAVIIAIYYRSGYRSRRGALRHGAAAVVVVGLLAFVAPDMRHAALDYLGLNPSKPAVEFEIHLPKTTASALAKEIEIVLGADENPWGAAAAGPTAARRPLRFAPRSHQSAGLTQHTACRTPYSQSVIA
jgi:hypothetical protein